MSTLKMDIGSNINSGWKMLLKLKQLKPVSSFLVFSIPTKKGLISDAQRGSVISDTH